MQTHAQAKGNWDYENVTATYSNTLQYTAIHCNTQQRVATLYKSAVEGHFEVQLKL